MKILFIGNSYTYYNDMPKLFERIARENGTEATCFSVTCGGRRLFEYTETEDDYSRQIDALTAEHRFDRVILQDHSVISLLDFEGFQRGVRQLEEKLRPCAKEFLLYETWGRKTGSETLAEHGWTNESMTFGIADAYRKLGGLLQTPVAYVGLKFYAVGRQHPEIELYDPDRTHPSYAGSCLAAITLYTAVFGSYPAKLASLALPEDVRAAFPSVF